MKKEIYMAGGCFWGMEKLFRSFPGVENVTVGYANINDEKNADYKTVCTGTTGARETIWVEYESEKISLEKLLEIYFEVVDPTIENQQGHDVGTQYQSGLYWIDQESCAIVQDAARGEASKHECFCVELKKLENFYPAEEYHQQYLDKNPGGYCHIPLYKIFELKAKYSK